MYNFALSKLDSRSSHRFFVGYPYYSKWYMFYNPCGGTRIMESQATKFLQLDVAEHGNCSRTIQDSGESEVIAPISLPIQMEVGSSTNSG